jgi:tRNA(Ile)-lysidine synthase
VVRPLIEIGRAELRQWLAERHHQFCEDESNKDLSFPRNRVRHELIPYLQREFSAGITDVLAREAAIASQDEDRLQQEASDLASTIVFPGETGDNAEMVEIDAEALTSLHSALGFRVARLALSILAPARFVGFEHLDRLLALARGPEGAAVSLPGQHAQRRGHKIVLRRQPFRAFANSFQFQLSIPGEVVLPEQGWSVSASWDNGTAPTEGSPLSATVQAEKLMLPLSVRSRRPGDRFRPVGLGGRGKKLQDFLVDRKIARETRDSLPLVVDGQDRIVWVVGESVAEDFRVTDPSQGVLLLKARRLGGLG